MAGPDKNSGEEGLTPCDAEDKNLSDQRFEENDELVNIEDTAEMYHTTEEERELQKSPKTDQVSADVESDYDEDSYQYQNQPGLTTDTVSANIDPENDVDVANIEEPVPPEDSETGPTADEAGIRGETVQWEGQAVELEVEAQSELNDRSFRLPLSRIKHIIKMDPDVTLASQEAVVTIAKAAELFIGTLARDASYKTIQGRRRVVMRKDLEHTMDTRDCYAFLEGAIDS